MVSLLSSNLRSIDIAVINNSDIRIIKDQVNEDEVVMFKGSMQVHQVTIQTCNQNILQMKTMSCFDCPRTEEGCKHWNLGKVQYTPIK